MDPFITRLLKVFAQYLCLYYYIDAIAWTIGPTDNLIYPANPTLFRDFAAIILFCAVMLQFSIARHYFEQISLIAETDSIGIREALGLKVVLTPIAEVSSFSLFVGLLGVMIRFCLLFVPFQRIWPVYKWWNFAMPLAVVFHKRLHDQLKRCGSSSCTCGA